MKVVPYRPTWGSVKMRGKKEAALSCRCCTIFNEKEEKLLKVVDKEARANFDKETEFLNMRKGYDLMSDEDELYNTTATYYDMYVKSLPL